MFLMAKGLNLLEINLVNFVFFGTLFIFEIPTGAFADVFGRKLSFVISCFLFAIGLIIYAYATSFWWFALGETISAIGATFSSGAFQAWLVDRLEILEYKGSINKVFAREQQIRSATGIIAALLGAFLADKNLSLPWIFAGCIMFAAGILAMIFMKEENFVRKQFSFFDGFRAMKETIQNSARYGMRNNVVRFIIIMGFVQYFAVQAPNMEWQPFFGHFVSQKKNFGFVYMGISIALIIGSALAPKFLNVIKNEKNALCIAQLIIGLGICITILCNTLVPAITIFLFHEIARGLFVPVKDAYLNDNIPSKERATLISFESISHHLGGMIGLLISGALAQYLSMRYAWIFSGITLIVSTLTFLKKENKK